MNKETLQERLEREAAVILADEGELISALLLHNLVTHIISETFTAYQRDEKLTVSDVYAYEAGYEAGKNELDEDIRLLTEEIERLREDVEIARKAGIDGAVNKVKSMERGIEWMQEGFNKDRKGYTDGYNQALDDTIKALQEISKSMEKKITHEDETFTIVLKVPRKMRGKYTYGDDEWEQDAICVFIDNSREEYGLFHTQHLDYKDSLQATSPIIFFDSQKEAEEFAANYRLMIEYGHSHTLEEALQDNK